jgi:hypothetical protein
VIAADAASAAGYPSHVTLRCAVLSLLCS